jgi:hypothetical protein
MQIEDDWLTIGQACVEIGGTEKPINPATFYRGANAGRYPKPEHPSPGIARVRKSKLRAAIASIVGETSETEAA